jgi:hypothetical protein
VGLVVPAEVPAGVSVGLFDLQRKHVGDGWLFFDSDFATATLHFRRGCIAGMEF